MLIRITKNILVCNYEIGVIECLVLWNFNEEPFICHMASLKCMNPAQIDVGIQNRLREEEP